MYTSFEMALIAFIFYLVGLIFGYVHGEKKMLKRISNLLDDMFVPKEQ